MELDLVELHYLLSRLPENSDDPKVCALKMKINTWIENMERKQSSDTSLDWFSDPQNQKIVLKEFFTIPYKIRRMTIKEFFFSHEKPTYIRLGNILTRRGFGVVEDLLELTVYQFTCIRGVGESGQKTILRSLIVHGLTKNLSDNEE
jgi:hypothetical protein